MIEALPGALYTTDAAGRITSYNPAAAELWGRLPKLGAEQWCGSNRLYKPDGTPMPHDESPMALALKEHRPIQGAEAIAERPDGGRVPFLAYVTLLRDPSGVITGAVNMLVDITERKRAEELALRLAAIVETSDDSIIGVDLNGIITSWNQGAERLLTYTAEEAVGTPVSMLIPPDRRDEERSIVRRVQNGEHVDHVETVRLRKDGSPVWVSLTVSPLKDPQGNVIGASRIGRDITERRRGEEHRRILIGELNHRVKNTLAKVQAIASQTLRNAASVEEARMSFETRLIALAKAHDLLTRESWESADLTDIVRDALELYAGANRFRIDGPVVRLGPEPALAIAMALHELSTNAAKYGALSRDDGCIDIVWRLKGDADGRRLSLRWAERGGPPVVPPQRKGFGSRLLERALAQELGGEVRVVYEPTGVICMIEAFLLADETKQQNAAIGEIRNVPSDRQG
ncbi:PAS domain S-box protein [Microvirga sp. BT350]|uniref:Blue-light-activated histidine kinase n=1 Tax=Microvirga alba TaxID=2791025 RepID=A0A931BV57_9HYPH|nr:PAS domain S-box protein [Microvirga alba]